MSTRMANAYALADKCWGKAYRAAPEFVEQYLTAAEQLLMSKPTVTGDAFRAHCKEAGVRLPGSLHPNTWVSGPRALQAMGWIEPICRVEPEQTHNHMPSVMLWRSKLFSGGKNT